ncbi:MAG: FAD-binding oxidoreductase, partial [Chthoniobacterales bacterium]
KENPELFSLVLGGYGLFGVILEAKLRVVSNEFYSAEAYEIVPANYSQIYHSLTQRKDAGMAYGRISVAPGSFLNEAVVVLLKRSKAPSPELLKAPLRASEESTLKRLVFRGSVGSDYGKNLRWQLEKLVGQKGGSSLTRNQIMNEPSEWFANRDPDATEILHEYFIPTERLWEFIKKARPVFLRHKPDLLNITVRNVEPDEDTFLCYAREEVFGLVMLFHQKRDEAAENAMRDFTRELIDVALDCGGTYYLPYRPHATLEQFKRGYPQARKFFRFKQLYDPDGVFENEFFVKYGKPLLKK